MYGLIPTVITIDDQIKVITVLCSHGYELLSCFIWAQDDDSVFPFDFFFMSALSCIALAVFITISPYNVISSF